jgi:hypothetical protein
MHYRDLIQELGLSQVGAGRFLGIDERTSRRWAHPDAPENAPPLAVRTSLHMLLTVRMLLHVMLRYGVTVEQVNELMGRVGLDFGDPKK